MSPIASQIVPLALGLVCAGIVAAVLAGKPLPLISNPRLALVVLLVLGMIACTGGIGQVGASGRWTSPAALSGMLLGVVILAVIAAGWFGWRLPGVASPKDAVVATAVLMAVKYVIGLAGALFGWL